MYVRTWQTQNDKFYKLPYMIIFLTNTLTHTVFHFPDYVNQLWAIRRTCTLKQAVRQILKTNNVTSFSFHVLCPYLTILNLVSVSKINIQWGCLPAFFLPSLANHRRFRVWQHHRLNFCTMVQVGLWTFITPWKSVKVQKMSSLVCEFFCILIPCTNTFLIPKPSGNWYI